MKGTDELVKAFGELSSKSVAEAGGKGASLGEMAKAGIPVPPGFVVLAGTFDRFIHETSLKAEIEAELDRVKHEEIESVERASETIQGLILNSKMTKDIEKAILASHKNLDAEFVAVRSSATAEDSASAAWAGQLNTYLNTTRKNLLENVKRCWASLFTPRAIFYRFEQKLHNHHVSVAVVVQRMVQPEASGIAFSVHPVTQDRNQFIIEAGLGLGEAIVSGQVTPDSYVGEKQPFSIIDKQVKLQDRMLMKDKPGGIVWRECGPAGGRQKLTDSQITELARLILKIENHYGFPCDIEWALEKGRFWITQSRPITTLSEAKIPEDKAAFELEFTREIPANKYYDWLFGYIETCRELGMDVGVSQKAFGVYENGVVKGYTQENNINTMKKAISGLAPKALDGIIKEYLADYALLKKRKGKAPDNNFRKRAVRGFIITFILGDMPGHGLQEKALNARAKTQDFFDMLPEKKHFEAPSGAGASILSAEGITPRKELESFLAKKNISIDNHEPHSESEMPEIVKSFVEELKGLEIAPPQRNSGLFIQASEWNSLKHFAGKYKTVPPFPVLFTMKGIEGIIYYPIGFAKKLTEQVFSEMWADPKALVRRITKQNELMTEADRTYDALTPEMVSAAKFSVLKSRLVQLIDSVCGLNASMFYTIYLDKEMVKALLEEQNGRCGAKEALRHLDSSWSQMTSMVEHSFEKRQELHVLSLIAKGASWDGITTACQYQHAAYAHISSWNETKELLKRRFEKIGKTKAAEEIAAANSEYNKRFSQYNSWKKTVPRPVQKLADFLQHTMAVRDARKDHLAKLMVGARRIAERAYSDAKVPCDLLQRTFLQEILEGPEYLSKNSKSISGRKDGYTVLVHHSGKKEETNEFDSVVLALDKFMRPETGQDGSQAAEIKGQVGNPGIVRGVARIVVNLARDGSKFKEGDILVTGMTRPEFISLMKKAAAVVTDEGGITCHAAIISRELNKPCVIGTKFATQILKDGDLVEVDADKGVVRILSQVSRPSTPVQSSRQFLRMFARDFSVAMILLGVEQEVMKRKPWYDSDFPFKPYIVCERVEGTVYMNYAQDGLDWVHEQIRKRVKEDSSFLKTVEQGIKKGISWIRPKYEEQEAISLKDLKRFIREFREAYPWIEAMWWIYKMDPSELGELQLMYLHRPSPQHCLDE